MSWACWINNYLRNQCLSPLGYCYLQTFHKIFRGVVGVIVRSLDLQLPMQSVPIPTTIQVSSNFSYDLSGCRGRDRPVVGFTTTYAISAYPHYDTGIFKLFLRSFGVSWAWSHGSWIYNYVCNQCLSPLRYRYLQTFLNILRCVVVVIVWWLDL